MSTLDEAIQAIRAGDVEEGRRILEEVLEVDENNEEVWLWLSSVVDNDEDREICLENVLALDPNNIVAQRGLEALQAGTFNVNNIIGEVFDEEEPETTFIDDFVITDDDTFGEDEELEYPSTMAPPTRKKKKTAKKGKGINLRLILLGLLIVVIVLVLAGVAVVNLFFLGGDDSIGTPTEQQTQGTPAQGGEEAPPEPTATETPSPTPTLTPTPTITRFELPTLEPTDLPTPTATPVVPPTPS